MLAVSLSNAVTEVFNYLLFLVLNHNVQKERLIQVEHKTYPHKSDAVLFVEWAKLPVCITNWVFEEASDVLECSPFLGIVTRFFCIQDELSEVTISFFCKSSKKIRNKFSHQIDG